MRIISVDQVFFSNQIYSKSKKIILGVSFEKKSRSGIRIKSEQIRLDFFIGFMEPFSKVKTYFELLSQELFYLFQLS